MNNYKNGSNTAWIVCGLIVLLLFCCSCGSRKSEVSKVDTKLNLTETVKEVTKTETEKQSETNVKTETTRTLDTKTNIVTETIKVTPIDATKPASFKNEKGVTVDLTNSIYEKQIKTDLSNVKEQLNTIEVYYKKELDKASTKATKDKNTILALRQQLKDKKIEKEGFNFLSLWWLLLIIPIYFLWKNYRSYLTI